jgi:uncharacterized protein YprB with RNaseH-like and TPR domain
MSKKSNELRCVHRHTLSEHPKCFAKGLVKNKEEYKNEKDFTKKTGQPWYTFSGYRIGYFDIETAGSFDADWGTVLSWCIKDKGGKIHSSVINKEELFSGVMDKRVVEEFVERLKDYSIIVGYYSTGFDLPYMRTKALRYGLDFPGYGDLYHWDLYYTVSNKLKLSRNSLDSVCDYLGIPGKTHLDKDVWRAAAYGDPKALKIVLEHNKGDVVITEQLHDKIDFTRKWLKRSI